MKNIIAKLAAHSEITRNPPVLMDIGASGMIHPFWHSIAPLSHVIAFDADSRDFQIISSRYSNYKKFNAFPCIVSEDPNSTSKPFFLTKSPHCSSTLRPETNNLKRYAFANLFLIDKEIKLESRTLTSIVDELGLTSIDWLKIDSQGTDLRLFSSLPENIQQNVIVAEFEPGIIDAYVGEDKLGDVLKHFRMLPFDIVKLDVKNVLQLPQDDIMSLGAFAARLAPIGFKNVPGWAELTFINRLEKESLRFHLLRWLFCSTMEHHTLALTYAQRGYTTFKDPLFQDMEIFSKHKMSRQVWALGTLAKALKLRLGIK